MTHGGASGQRWLMLWGLLVLGCAARLINLDADPKFADWIYWIQDEGRWVEAARSLALFGDPGLYDISRLHLVLSPGYQAAVYSIFKLAGVNLWSARLCSAVCGAAILCVAFIFLRRRIIGFPLTLGLVILAFEPLGLSMSRVAIPEMPALLFTFLAFVALCARERLYLTAFVSGFCIAVAISMKGTTALVAPVFLLMAVVSGDEHGASRRGLRLLACLGGMALPATVCLVIALAAGKLDLGPAPHLLRMFAGFFTLAVPYDLAARFLGVHNTGNLNLLLLGAWLCSWLVIFRKEFRGKACGELYVLSAVWWVGWLAIWTLMKYLPERYYVHVLLPLGIHLVAGLALWRQIGVGRVLDGIATQCTRRGAGVIFWLVLPAAVVVAAWCAPLASLAGLSVDRLREQVFLIAAVAGGMTVVLRVRGVYASAVPGFIAFPIVVALAAMLAGEVLGTFLAWPIAEAALPVVKLGIIAIAGGRLISAPIRLQGAGASSFAPVLAVATVAATLLLSCLPVLLAPTYSMRDASRDLERRFRDVGLVRSSGAGTLFIETHIHYRDSPTRDTPADAVVNFDRVLSRGPAYTQESGYRIAIHPDYHHHGKPRARVEAGAALVEVYRLRPALPVTPAQADR